MKISSLIACGMTSLPQAISDRLHPTWTALVAGVLFFLAGMGSHAAFGDFRSFEGRIGTLEAVVGIANGDTLDDRVEELEDWQRKHVVEVTRPNVQKIERVRQTQQEMLSRMGRVERLLSCIHYRIDQCPGAPPPPPSVNRP